MTPTETYHYTRALSAEAEARKLAALIDAQQRPRREQEQREREQFAGVAIAARAAASRRVCCEFCGCLLDQSRTVLMKYPLNGEVAYCACCGSCADKTVGMVVVSDGRTVPSHLWKLTSESLIGHALVGARQEASR